MTNHTCPVAAVVAMVTALAACSGSGTSQPEEGGASGAAGQGSGGGAAGSGAPGGSGALGGGGGGSAGQAGAAAAGGTSSGAGAGSGGSDPGGAGGSSAGVAGMSGGPPMIPQDAGSGACHDYTPCGGDVVGSWNIDICVDPPFSGLRTFCPEATETSEVTGTADMRADGTMTSSLRIAFETTLPASCVAELGPCGEAGQGLGLLEECTPGQAGSCICESVNAPEPSDATYTTTPEGLLTITRDGEPSYTYYCRQGEEMWARGVDASDGRISVLHFTKR